MRVIRHATQIARLARRYERQGKRIGVVPTMGALHEGHLSLIRAAAAANDVVIVTVFVNPLQFGPGEDCARYPRNLPRDVRLAASAGAACLFAPSVRELYPPGFQTTIDVGPLGTCWEGRVRPGHFRGVATVVHLLFQLTRPTNAYFGQKDYQQTLVVKRLAEDLKLPVRIHVLPTVREPDGLAMSSRNAFLTPSQRRQATVLFRALMLAYGRIVQGERRAAPLLHATRRLIRAETGVRMEYVAIVDATALASVRTLRGCVVVLLAVRIGRTRLIDNVVVAVS